MMIEKTKIPVGGSLKDMLNFYKKNRQCLINTLEFLDSVDPGWRHNPPMYFKELINLGKDLKIKQH